MAPVLKLVENRVFGSKVIRGQILRIRNQVKSSNLNEVVHVENELSIWLNAILELISTTNLNRYFESIATQTRPPCEVVLLKDEEIPKELQRIVEKWAS